MIRLTNMDLAKPSFQRFFQRGRISRQPDACTTAWQPLLLDCPGPCARGCLWLAHVPRPLQHLRIAEPPSALCDSIFASLSLAPPPQSATPISFEISVQRAPYGFLALALLYGLSIVLQPG